MVQEIFFKNYFLHSILRVSISVGVRYFKKSYTVKKQQLSDYERLPIQCRTPCIYRCHTRTLYRQLYNKLIRELQNGYLHSIVNYIFQIHPYKWKEQSNYSSGSVPQLIRQPAKYIFYEIIASSRRRTNNFNENSGVEFRGKSDISCYVQSNASLPRRDNASPHTLCNSGSRHSEAMLLLLFPHSRYTVSP